METLLTIFAWLAINFQSTKDIPLGKYSYHTNRYYESIDLKSGNKFTYNVKQEFFQFEINGNFIFRGDTIVLDSYPQRDKIIVNESNQSNLDNTTILVTNKMGDFIHYHLYLVLSNDTIMNLQNQWMKSRIEGKKIKGFYIIDSKGLRSPMYYIKGKLSNYFNVQFESKRTFENETWLIQNNKICPRGLDGELQEYFLEK